MENDNQADIHTIPLEYYSPEHRDIWKLIKNIDGYRMFGEQLGDQLNGRSASTFVSPSSDTTFSQTGWEYTLMSGSFHEKS